MGAAQNNEAMKAKLTPFEEALNAASAGELKTPVVTYEGRNIDPFKYQLAVHKFQLGIMKSGMQMRGVKLKDLKWYYGLKGRSAADVHAEFMENIFNVLMPETKKA